MVKKVNEPNLIKKTYHSYVVLDLETTGLDPLKDSITEIGMIKVKNDQIIAEYERLVHPKKKIPLEITNLTGITNSMVRNEPYIEEIIEEIKAFIGPDLIMGHKISMDLAFLQQVDPFFDMQYLDTLRYARKAFPYLQSCALSTLTEEFDLITNTHRALDDVYATKALYDHILEKRGSIERVYTFNSLIDGIDEKIIEEATMNDYFQGKHCVVSGYFRKCSKATINEILKRNHATCSDSVDSTTEIFILGEHAKALSKKHKQVLQKIQEGQEIIIIEEEKLYEMIGI